MSEKFVRECLLGLKEENLTVRAGSKEENVTVRVGSKEENVTVRVYG